jgi:hypothetical protein
LFLDGVYVNGADARFRWVKAPTDAELSKLTHTIAYRIGRYLERQGLLARDAENAYLALENSDEEPMDQLRGYSITYRIAVGLQQGLAALVPRPRVNLTCYHGVFAPTASIARWSHRRSGVKETNPG